MLVSWCAGMGMGCLGLPSATVPACGYNGLMATDSEPSRELQMRYRHEKKKLPCRVCGVPIEVGIRTQKAPRCVECGIAAAVDAAIQMHNHSGPYYEAFLKRSRKGGRPKSRGTPVGNLESSPESSL